MKKHKTTYSIILFSGLVFFLFTLGYLEYDGRRAQAQIEEHARIIADALWNYNETGAAEYLSLAAKSHDYELLMVKDASGKLFQVVKNNTNGWMDAFLIKAALIPRRTISADIVYRDAAIGRIEAVWRSKAVYVIAYVLFAAVLSVVIILLYLRLLQGKQILETRVRERTAELAQSNRYLQLQVSERKRAEDALRESREVLKTTFDSMNDGVLVVAANGSIIQSNARFAQMWSIPDEVMASGMNDVTIECVLPQLTDPENFVAGTRDIFRAGQVSEDLVHFKNGRVIERISVPFRQEGRPDGRVWLFRDITDRMRAEKERASLQAQLQQVQKMDAIGTLSSGIAHDFNNIMQAISGYIQLLQQNGKWEESTPRHLKEMATAIDKASGLVQGLLTFGRKVEPKLEPLDLNQAILDMIKILERTIPKMIHIETSLAENLKIVDADPTQFQRIILNLTTNARDAMPEGGRLCIETENVVYDRDNGGPHPGLTSGEWVRLSFSDNGIGMAEETVQRIFEPFFTTKGVGRGAGLGLPAAYGIVKTHSGHIFCQSRPGKGTRFDIYFPVSPYSIQPAPQSNNSDRKTAIGGRETVLLVDDELSIRETGKAILENNGYTVLTADRGEKAIEIYRRDGGEVDLVVLDLGMPGIGGHSCLKELLIIDPEIKVLVASGYSAAGLVREILKLGAVGFIAKPYRLTDLLKRVRSILDRGAQDA